MEAPRCRILRCRTDDCGCGFYSGAKHAVVEDCRFYKIRDAFAVPTYPQDDTAIQFYSPASEGEVRGCLGVGFCNGIFLKCPVSPFLVEHNTMVDGISYGMGCYTWHPQSVCRYNIIDGFSEPIWGHDRLAGAVVDENCLWGPQGKEALRPYLDGPRRAGTGRNSIAADPRLAAPAAGDYRLSADSPCLRMGPGGESCGAFGVVGKAPPPAARDTTRIAVRPRRPAAALPPSTTPTVPATRPGPEGPQTYFVSPEGEDLAGRGSRPRPWHTLQFAVDRARPGDRIRLLPGLYPGQTTLTRGGLPEAPLVIQSETPGAAILDAHHEFPACLQLVKAPHVVIEGLELRWFGRPDRYYSNDKAGISIVDSPNVSVRHCKIWNGFWTGWTVGSGIYANRSPGLVADHNVMWQMEQGIYLYFSPRARITHNTILINMYGRRSLPVLRRRQRQSK